jgi:hypothetical protein
MLFNPKAERFTFRYLRALAINTRPDLKAQLNECLKTKEFSDHVYSMCRKTESDRQAFGEEVAVLQSKSAAIMKATYEHIRQELLVSEVLYGFGMVPPVTPQSAIEIIPSHCWLSLTLNPDKSEAFGHGLHYVNIFFQRKEDLPPETIALMQERQRDASAVMPEVDKPEAPEQKVQPAAGHYVSSFIELQLDAARHFDIDPANPPYKEAVVEWVSAEATKRGIKISPGNIERMATFIRNPEAQKGGNRIVRPKKKEKATA